MEEFKELYVLGEPIDTRIGKLHFLKINEYKKIIPLIPYLNLQKNQIISKVGEFDKDIAELMKELELLYIIKYNELSKSLKEYYVELFKLCFKEDVFDLIESNEEFEYYRDLIRKINFIPLYIPNSNPEIERFNQMKIALANKKSDATSFESMYTSVWLSLGYEPRDITLYQLHSLFNRIGMFKNYDTTTMYSLLSNEIKIESWYKHVDTIESERDKGENLGDVVEEINKKLDINKKS